MYFNIDSLHRDIIYDYYGDEEMEIYYVCNKYRFYLNNDYPIFFESSLNSCYQFSQHPTIIRQYFGLPNYFYRYSVWYLSGNGQYDYNYNDPASFISYTNSSYDICTASG